METVDGIILATNPIVLVLYLLYNMEKPRGTDRSHLARAQCAGANWNDSFLRTSGIVNLLVTVQCVLLFIRVGVGVRMQKSLHKQCINIGRKGEPKGKTVRGSVKQ